MHIMYTFVSLKVYVGGKRFKSMYLFSYTFQRVSVRHNWKPFDAT
jgi:hypothetical protein